MFVMWGKQNKTALIYVNISFIARENPLNTNENSLERSLSAMKFHSNYHRVPRNFAQTIAECREISLKLAYIAAKYRCLLNNRTREISLKNRSKQNFANYCRIFANFAELRLHYFCTILYFILEILGKSIGKYWRCVGQNGTDARGIEKN